MAGLLLASSPAFPTSEDIDLSLPSARFLSIRQIGDGILAPVSGDKAVRLPAWMVKDPLEDGESPGEEGLEELDPSALEKQKPVGYIHQLEV